MWASKEFRLAVRRVRLTQASPQRMLTSMLRISAGEAFRRVHAAEALAERMSMTGEPLDPVRPLLAAAQRTGEISSEHPNDQHPHPRHPGGPTPQAAVAAGASC